MLWGLRSCLAWAVLSMFHMQNVLWGLWSFLPWYSLQHVSSPSGEIQSPANPWGQNVLGQYLY